MYKITSPRRIPTHYLECFKAGEHHYANDLGVTANNELNDDASQGDRDHEDVQMTENRKEDDGDDDDQASDTEENQLDPQDVQIQEEDYMDAAAVTEVPTKDSSEEVISRYRREKYGKLTKYLASNPLDNITAYPVDPIPPVPFAIDKTLYLCPIATCSSRFADKLKAKTHIGKHSTHDNEDDGYLHTDPHPAQQLFTCTNSPRFLVLSQEVTFETVSSGMDKIRHQLQPMSSSSTRLIDGPQQLNLYMKRMGLYRAFPADRSTYNQFVSQRIVKVSMIYHTKQPLQIQLLTIAIFVYLMSGREALRSQDHLIARHIGNKLRRVILTFRSRCDQP
jgi:hypothetical protein